MYKFINGMVQLTMQCNNYITTTIYKLFNGTTSNLTITIQITVYILFNGTTCNVTITLQTRMYKLCKSFQFSALEGSVCKGDSGSPALQYDGQRESYVQVVKLKKNFFKKPFVSRLVLNPSVNSTSS